MNTEQYELTADDGLDDLSKKDQLLMLGLGLIPIVLATWWHVSQVFHG